MLLSMTSETMTRGQLYDAASTILAQKLSQVKGIGQVTVGGGSLPAVRVEMNPQALHKYGIGTAEVRAAIEAANANGPKGFVEDGDRHWQIGANDQAMGAAEYMPLIVAYRNGAAVQMSDIAQVVDSVQDLRNAGLANGRPSVLVILNRQPGANIIETVDGVRAALPQLRASIPSAIDLEVMMDRTPTIRASLHEVERTLLISVALVIMVVFLFLRRLRATLIPTVAVPVSLLGTFGVMHLCGYSLNNLSLMALTVATGFVVDDAIVVMENISRKIEDGMPAMKAALAGVREVGFTVHLHEPFADSGVHPHPDDGRHRRAPVPGIRRDLVRGGPGIDVRLPDGNADDVRAPAAPGAGPRGRPVRPDARARLRWHAQRL